MLYYVYDLTRNCLTFRVSIIVFFINGEMAEWTKAAASKAVVSI